MQAPFYFHLHDWLFTMLMVSARVMPTFILLPFFNNAVLTGALRMPVAMLVSIGLWPNELQQIPDIEQAFYLGLLAKELLIGVLIAFFLSLPFWILHAVGSIIDNQRGATLSSSLDPISGVDSSELANFLNLFTAVVVLQSGGLLLLLEVFEQSYRLWHPLDATMPSIMPVLGFLGSLFSKALLLASPLLAAFLLTEVLLGLLGRFAPQLNPFALALTVKSFVAFLLLLIYFISVFPGKIIHFQFVAGRLDGWL